MIYEKLYSWQKRIVDKFKHRQSFGLFLDMGLGKTPLSLAFAEQNNCTNVIIITLNSKVMEDKNVEGSWLNWASQSTIPYNPLSKHSNSIVECPLLLINYESLSLRNKVSHGVMLRDSVKAFIESSKGKNVALIIDESHKTKNLQSLQTKSIIMIQKLLKLTASNVYTYLLTGTPFTTGYIDLYTQLKLLGYDANKTTFTDMFCVKGNLPGLLGWQQPIVGYKNIDMLYELIHNYALTIKSDDVVDLPEQTFVYHTLPTNNEFTMFVIEKVNGYDILEENKKRIIKLKDISKYETKSKVNNPYYRNIAYPDLKWLAETSGTFWLRARQLSIGFQGNSKDSVWYDKSRLEMLETFLTNNKDNYVLFYNFTPELIELYQICEKLGYNIDVYCGEIKSMYFYEKYQEMNEDERFQSKNNIILANFASGSTGKNWQLYNKCIIFSMPLFKDYEQGIKRIHRLGQTKTVFYHIFYQKNWLDISMKKALETQSNYSSDMFEADLKRINEIFKED